MLLRGQAPRPGRCHHTPRTRKSRYLWFAISVERAAIRAGQSNDRRARHGIAAAWEVGFTPFTRMLDTDEHRLAVRRPGKPGDFRLERANQKRRISQWTCRQPASGCCRDLQSRLRSSNCRRSGSRAFQLGRTSCHRRVEHVPSIDVRRTGVRVTVDCRVARERVQIQAKVSAAWSPPSGRQRRICP